MTNEALQKGIELKEWIDQLEKDAKKDQETVEDFFHEWNLKERQITLTLFEPCAKKSITVNFNGDHFEFIKDFIDKHRKGQAQLLESLKAQLAAL